MNVCDICWSTLNSGLDFQLSGPGGMGITDYRLCCGYGNAGTDTRGFDCLIIPAASSENGNALNAAEFCGASLGLASRGSRTADVTGVQTVGLTNKSICCKRQVLPKGVQQFTICSGSTLLFSS